MLKDILKMYLCFNRLKSYHFIGSSFLYHLCKLLTQNSMIGRAAVVAEYETKKFDESIWDSFKVVFFRLFTAY